MRRTWREQLTQLATAMLRGAALRPKAISDLFTTKPAPPRARKPTRGIMRTRLPARSALQEATALTARQLRREALAASAVDGQVLATSCALGAAFEGTVGTAAALRAELGDVSIYAQLARRYPVLDRDVRDPVTREVEPLESAIMNLNDSEDWSRERIARWLRALARRKRPPIL